jgi:hypothetical protein
MSQPLLGFFSGRAGTPTPTATASSTTGGPMSSDYEWHHDPPPEPGAEGQRCNWCADLGVDRPARKMLAASGICFDCYTNMSARVLRREQGEAEAHSLADGLDALADAMRRFVAWPSEHFPRVVALWVAHTHTSSGPSRRRLASPC